MISDDERFKMIKASFTLDTKLPSEYNLLVGIIPCPDTLTISIIDYACNNNRDFYIAFCPCALSNYIRLYPNAPLNEEIVYSIYEEKYINYAREMIKRFGLGSLEVMFPEYGYNQGIPIIYNRR